MPNSSCKTKVIAFRVPAEVYAIIERRIKGKRSHWKTISEYLRERVCYDLTRSHRSNTQRAGDNSTLPDALPDSQSQKPSRQP